MLAVIPARSGSKRIPKKNIKSFNNRPIISYAIETALNSLLFSDVIVSTDCEEIAEISISYGATVPFIRKKNLSGDFTSTVLVVRDAITRFKKGFYRPDFVCCLYPCTPLLSTELLKSSYTLLQKPENSDRFVFPILEFPSPPQRALSLIENNKIKSDKTENQSKRCQDFQRMYYDAGQFYFACGETWFSYNHIHECGTGILIGPGSGIDIDNQEQWDLVEKIYNSTSI